MSIDYHTHSYYSDGELSPTALLQHAVEQGLQGLALTDHDSTAGLEEAHAAARDLGLKLVPGVEISASWGKTNLHVLGLNIDPTAASLVTCLRDNCLHRDTRAQAISKKLEKVGIHDVYAHARALAKGDIICRTHIADYLLQAGHASDYGKAFKRYLAAGKAGHIASDWPALEKVISAITAAGGIAVLAHPMRYGLTATRLRHLLYEFKAFGGAGIEVASPHLQQSQMESLTRLSIQFELYASQGSDYHGPSKQWTQLGRFPALPKSCNSLHLELTNS